MKAACVQTRSWVTVIAGSAVLAASLSALVGTAQAEPHKGEILVAMALFGGDDQKPTTPPPKPPASMPQASPVQGSVKPAGTTGSGQAPAPVVQPGTAGSTAKPATLSPTATMPAPTPATSAPAVTSQGEKTTLTQAPVGEAKEPPKPPDAASASATASVAVPTTEASDGYSYDPKSRRDPFQALTKAIKNEKVQLDVPPLQRFQLSDVRILGIIWGGYGYYGLIQTPDGKGYTVKEGMLMGTNNGVIKAITDKAIIVSEPAIDFAGKKIEKEVELLLRPKEVS